MKKQCVEGQVSGDASLDSVSLVNVFQTVFFLLGKVVEVGNLLFRR